MKCQCDLIGHCTPNTCTSKATQVLSNNHLDHVAVLCDECAGAWTMDDDYSSMTLGEEQERQRDEEAEQEEAAEIAYNIVAQANADDMVKEDRKTLRDLPGMPFYQFLDRETPLPEIEELWWSGRDMMPPPAVGSTIKVTMNALGLARVTGYFVQDGYLGVRAILQDPPEWLVEQHKRTALEHPEWDLERGHFFGSEISCLD